MDRRLALKQLALLTGGMMAFPSCDFSQEKVLEAYEKLQVIEAHRNLLAKVVETILPGGDIVGARELNMQDFVLVMANDCLNEEDQSRFVSGLKNFDVYVKKVSGSSFEKMGQKEAEQSFNTIVQLEDEREDVTDLKYFLNTTKRFTLQGYLSSEYFMTEVMPYNMVPGGFQGEKIIDPSEKINING
ncbi:MAG TPA: gluconate 2-dehydrogenase subunit 3 family protein [Cyclobacteriaceae bacterium]|nr:gluconate 2-dehydrogenase subunit 3 family protein [Cyclobacteriaceae bacterium]